MESADLLRVASDSWRLFFHWTGEYWPALCLPALFAVLAWVAAYWNYLLARPFGRYWPVPAALLPALIPLARSLEENASTGVQTFTVAVLLLAVAVFQLYGQQRNNNERDQQATRINRIATEVKCISTRVNNLATEVERISTGVNNLGTEIERISTGVNSIGSATSSLFAYLQGQEEEDEKEGD
jgi:uncharacterized protein YoxC